MTQTTASLTRVFRGLILALFAALLIAPLAQAQIQDAGQPSGVPAQAGTPGDTGVTNLEQSPADVIQHENWVQRMFFPERASTWAGAADGVMFFIFYTSAFFFILLMGLVIYFTWKYRRRAGVPQERSASHNTSLELTWSVVPTILMAVMFVWGFVVYMDMQTVPAGAETINVSARKWAWTFEYDNGASSLETIDIGGAEYPVYAVPVNRPVRLLLHSQDVIHSIFVPAFRHKIDVFPNRYTVYWFEATEVGDYQLFCAEYCGDAHSQMMALIKVMSESDYQQWRGQQASTDDIPLVQLGETLRLTKGCAQCHSVDGSGGTGPSWQGIFGATHQVQPGGAVTVDENYLRESILYPGNQIVAGYPNQMPVYAGQLQEREVRAIIAYIASLSGPEGEAAAEQMMQEDQAQREGAAGTPEGAAEGEQPEDAQ